MIYKAYKLVHIVSYSVKIILYTSMNYGLNHDIKKKKRIDYYLVKPKEKAIRLFLDKLNLSLSYHTQRSNLYIETM